MLRPSGEKTGLERRPDDGRRRSPVPSALTAQRAVSRRFWRCVAREISRTTISPSGETTKEASRRRATCSRIVYVRRAVADERSARRCAIEILAILAEFLEGGLGAGWYPMPPSGLSSHGTLVRHHAGRGQRQARGVSSATDRGRLGADPVARRFPRSRGRTGEGETRGS